MSDGIPLSEIIESTWIDSDGDVVQIVEDKNELVFRGKYTDWRGDYSEKDKILRFTRFPTVEQMGDGPNKPDWAKMLIAGTARWRMELSAKVQQKGEEPATVLSGKWFADRFKGDPKSNTAKVVSEGQPREVFYTQATCDERMGDRIYSIARVGDKDTFKIEASSEEPLGREGPPIAVKVATITREPAQMIEVKWHVSAIGGKTLSTDFHSVTGADGVGRLDFIMLPEGDFAVANEYLRPDYTLPPGKYNLAASAPDIEVNDTINFTVELSASGVLINITDAAGWGVSSLSLNEGKGIFEVRVIDREAKNDYPEITVHLSYEGYSLPVDFTLSKKALGVYARDNYPMLVFNRELDRITLDKFMHRIKIPDTARVELSVTAVNFTRVFKLPVFASEEARLKFELESANASYLRLLDDIEASLKTKSPADQAALNYRRALVEHAKAILKYDPDKLSVELQNNLAKGYLELLRSPGQPPPQKGQWPFPRTKGFKSVEELRQGLYSPEDVVQLPYASGIEFAKLTAITRNLYEKAVYKLEQIAEELKLQLANIPTKFTDAPKACVRTLGDMLASPVYLAYVIVYGATLDGEEADIVDRLSAGLDLVNFEMNSRPRARISRFAAEKRGIGAFLKSHGIERNDLRLSQWNKNDLRRFASASPKLQMIGDGVLKSLFKTGLADELKRKLYNEITRIQDLKIAGMLRTRLEYFVGGSTKQVLNDLEVCRLVGHMEHLRQCAESKIRWLWKVEQKLAEVTPQGGFRRGHIEHRFNWKIPNSGGKEPDHIRVNHRSNTVCISDLTRTKNPEHIRKGILEYKPLIEKLAEFKGYKVTYREFYWDKVQNRLLFEKASW